MRSEPVSIPNLPTRYFLAHAFPDIAHDWEQLWPRIERARSQYQQLHASTVLVPGQLTTFAA